MEKKLAPWTKNYTVNDLRSLRSFLGPQFGKWNEEITMPTRRFIRKNYCKPTKNKVRFKMWFQFEFLLHCLMVFPGDPQWRVRVLVLQPTHEDHRQPPQSEALGAQSWRLKSWKGLTGWGWFKTKSHPFSILLDLHLGVSEDGIVFPKMRHMIIGTEVGQTTPPHLL